MKKNILSKFRIVFCLLVCLCLPSTLYPQVGNHSKKIHERIIENQTLFQDDPAEAFRQIDELQEEAIRMEDTDSELLIMSKRYEYNYLLKIDFEEMISSANALRKKAVQYKAVLYEAKSHKYLAQAYAFNELYEKALDELKKAMEILEKANQKDSKIIMEKANVHTAFANVYNFKKEYFSGIQSLLSSAKEHDKLTDPDQKRGTKYMDYANLGGAYLNVNLDSARYYVNKSISLSTKDEADHDLTFLNYIVLGDVSLAKKEYEQALGYYKKAEAIKENKHFINIETLYKNLIATYEKLGRKDLKEAYETKLKDLSLTVSQNQNKSLRKIIRENKSQSFEEAEKDNVGWFIALFLAVVVIAAVIFLKRKPEKREPILTPEIYNELIRLLKENDQTFLLAFENEFPDFTQHLLKISTDLSGSEIELLAMIKLGLSNKEIAQYKFIQHKTVQNRRHKIRKKLNLSSTTDLDKWVENI